MATELDMGKVGRIDVHAHLIPRVDDGCPDVGDSVACGRALAAAGYTHAVCTPHVWVNLPRSTVENVRRWTARLQGDYDAAGVGLTLVPGGEYNLTTVAVDRPADQFVTYNLGGRYVLFDFWADELPAAFEPAVRGLIDRGFELVLAHPERIAAFQHDPTLVDRVAAWGVRFQMNTWCLTAPESSPTRTTAERLLRDGRYFLFGTDTHNFAGMDVRLRGVELAIEMVGAAAVDELTRTNPAKLLAG